MRAEITAGTDGTPTIKIDGHDIADAIRSYRLEHDAADTLPLLTVELPVAECADFSGNVRLHLDTATRDLLIEHGWTPPEIPTAVTDFVAQRADYITALNNCQPENLADYHRWQGHAEARRQLAEQLERASR